MIPRRAVSAFLLALAAGSAAGQQRPASKRNGALPAVSPDGSRIAFVSDRDGNDDLFVISAGGSNEIRLTNTPEKEGAPGWTADGQRIFVSVGTGESSRLYAIDPDGRNRREIAAVAGRAPVLSPDGRRLVFEGGTWTATRLMVSAADGSGAKALTDGTSIAWNCHWSPDSKWIAYTGRGEPADGLAIFLVRADGTGSRRLTRIAPEEGRAQWPAFSPDGRRVAVQVNGGDRESPTAHIWIVDAATGDGVKLAAHARAYLDETPSWFPDGRRLAFQSNRTGRMEIWVMNADGSDPRQVTGSTGGNR